MIFPVYFLNCLLWTILGAFFVSLAQPVAFYALTEGQYGRFFATAATIALKTVPAATVCSFSVVYIYVMRHKTKKRVAVPLTVFLFVLTAGILVPLSLMTGEKRAGELPENRPPKKLAEAGFVRTYQPNERLLWLENGEDGSSVSALVSADVSRGDKPTRLTEFEAADFDKDAAALVTEAQRFSVPYYNPDIVRELEMPGFLAALAKDIRSLNAIFSDALRKGAASYLWLGGSFFAVIGSLFFLCFLTDWKLINILIYAVALRFAYRVFPLLCGGEPHLLFRRLLPAFLSDETVSALPAVLFALLLCAVGILWLLPRYRKENPGGPNA